MSEGMAFTELEEGLFGPDGTQVLRRTAGRLVSLRADVDGRVALGLSPAEAAQAGRLLAALTAAERIMIDLTANGDRDGNHF